MTKRKDTAEDREDDDLESSEAGTTGADGAEAPVAEGVPPPPDPESAERVYTDVEVRAKLAAAEAEAKDRQLRLAAEYDNFRRRVQREKEQWTGEAIERFVADLLPVLDDFDRALVASRDAPSALSEGVRLTEKALRAALSRHGVEVVDPEGAKFDPNLHEAVQRVPPTEETPPGTVVRVFEKGYTLKGRLLRPARVQVAGD